MTLQDIKKQLKVSALNLSRCTDKEGNATQWLGTYLEEKQQVLIHEGTLSEIKATPDMANLFLKKKYYQHPVTEELFFNWVICSFEQKPIEVTI